ncbi:MAG: RNA methyltransferase [Treponema sp.]|nr:RNA methyltransferase [Treponema sp.]
MDLKKICIILVRPEESRNIGAACRAMANNGINDMRIVGKRTDYNDEKIHILAIHAGSIWEQAHFYASITEAASDCTLSAGTTRRRGKHRKGKLLLPEEFASKASDITGINSVDKGGVVAAVFGNERTGLTDAEMAECTLGVTIPSSEEFASLNLSHAVQIICYHLFREKNKGITGYTPLSLSRLDKTVTNIADNLQKIGFFSVTGRTDMEKFWRSILSRAALSESEAKYIEKIFTKTAGLVSKNSQYHYS